MAAGAKYNFTSPLQGPIVHLQLSHLDGRDRGGRRARGRAGASISIPSGAGSPNGAPGYSPANFTVIIGTNNTVTWTNNDNAHHTVTATDNSFNSGNMAAGAKFTYVFKTAGTYNYICNYHTWMKGTVTVKA